MSKEDIVPLLVGFAVGLYLTSAIIYVGVFLGLLH